MDVENAQSQMRKGILEFCILSVIAKREVYPTEIIDELRAANLRILEGTLYPLLTRLKNAEMLGYRWVESTSGPPRKYFSLTPRGQEFLLALQKTWDELEGAVNAVISGIGIDDSIREFDTQLAKAEQTANSNKSPSEEK